ncbi:MAG: DLW-39 family protein [Mycobacteriales bacterium]
MVKRLALLAAVSTIALVVVRKLRAVRDERELWEEAISAPELVSPAGSAATL